MHIVKNQTLSAELWYHTVAKVLLLVPQVDAAALRANLPASMDASVRRSMVTPSMSAMVLKGEQSELRGQQRLIC